MKKTKIQFGKDGKGRNFITVFTNKESDCSVFQFSKDEKGNQANIELFKQGASCEVAKIISETTI